MKRAMTTAVMACVLAGALAISTLADELAFVAPIAGSNPNVTIAGVGSGGAPWVVRHGAAVLTDSGKLRVDVRGLVLPSAGNTAGPVTKLTIAPAGVCMATVTRPQR